MKQATRRTVSLLLLSLALLSLLTAGCVPENTPTDGPGTPEGPGATGPDKNDPYLILVSAKSPLPENLIPELKPVQGNFQLETKAADAFLEMFAGAEQEGIKLLLVSAFRSQATQTRLFTAKVQEFLNQGYNQADAEAKAATIVARPGTSEHNAGLAADIVTPEYRSLNKGYAETPAAKWLAENAHRYGFILRYPEGKQEITGIIYEPWHFRYVGPEHAKAIKEAGLCLEEYLQQK